MDIGIEPSKKQYLIPFMILAIGGLIFYYLLMQNIFMFTHLLTEVVPGESLTIEARENQEYYILLDTISRDYLTITPLSDTTEVYYFDQEREYDIQFSIYEENNLSNIDKPNITKGMKMDVKVSNLRLTQV